MIDFPQRDMYNSVKAAEKELTGMDATQESALAALRSGHTTEALWNALEALEGEAFLTAKGLSFTYVIRGGELFVSRKEKSITRATVELAFQRALELGGDATGPKKLGVFGASYLYPIFLRLGILSPPPEAAYEEMRFSI